jgi:hypothetical protein
MGTRNKKKKKKEKKKEEGKIRITSSSFDMFSI